MSETPASSFTIEAVKKLILESIARTLKVDESAIDTNKPILEMGVDSISAVTMTAELEEKLGISIDPIVILDTETVDLLSEYLFKQVSEA